MGSARSDESAQGNYMTKPEYQNALRVHRLAVTAVETLRVVVEAADAEKFFSADFLRAANKEFGRCLRERDLVEETLIASHTGLGGKP